MRPTPRAILLLALGVPAGIVLGLIAADYWLAAAVVAPALAFLGGVDVTLSPSRRRIGVDVRTPDAVHIGSPSRLVVTLRIGEPASAHRCELLCEVSAPLTAPAAVDVGSVPQGVTAVDVPIHPERRGRATVDRIWIRWRGPIGLIELIHCVDVDRPIDVIPNIGAVRAMAIQFHSRDATFGLKPDRLQGDGTEFAAMREYLPGLDLRSMDWKQSAKHRKLICKEFESDRSQPIVLAIDTGHLMREPLAGIPKLDHAINAALMIAYASLRAGDRVGTFGFDAQVRHFAVPKEGVSAFSRIQRNLAGFDYRTEETNFTLGMMDLLGRLNRRSLVIVMTEFVDTITADLMVENLGRLARRHLLLFVTLRSPDLEAFVDAAPGTFADVTRAVVADGFQRDRWVVLERLRRLGILCLEAPYAEIGTALVNRYLAIKRDGLI